MTPDRRTFLGLVGGAALAWPRTLEALARQLAGGGAPDDEAFWDQVRGHFLIPPDRIYLNNGTLGPPPRVVVDAVAEHARRVAETYPPGVDWDDLKAALAGLLGGDPGGFVVPRNTTEAMNFVAHGLELAAGEVVVTTDHEHIGGLEPWRLIAARRGVELRVATLPVPPGDEDEVLEAVWSAVDGRTRVLSVSHVTFTTGLRLPVERLAARCRAQAVTFVVDGAHPPGMLRVDLEAVGGDFYASSPHKWLLAPQGTGLLWLAPEWRTRLWPTLASGGWDDLGLGAHRLNHMGTMDESRMAGLLAAVGFFETVGMDRVEGRIRHLRERLTAGLAGIGGCRVVSPPAGPLASGMVSFSLEGVDPLDLQAWLAREARIRTRVIGEYDYGWMRLSTHLYTRPAEIDRTLELLARAARTGVPPRNPPGPAG